MRICDGIFCTEGSCADVRRDGRLISAIDIDPAAIRVVLISESAPQATEDSYYAPGDPLFARTTREAFRDAGLDADQYVLRSIPSEEPLPWAHIGGTRCEFTEMGHGA